ncbi:hypothetical protein RND61_04765 [Streptomyces sp. TRM76323]|uniref:Uncharacterized protein n=1 Tax=Streptomyces tamarix TaxID=3078565 RepID=A0ABU3QFW0_9ACTN|nr:hypothetical protein [Streptomyces tamarix]MDT9681388.1 hypothetical protein [Streptomyces tamarix]
MFSLCFHIRIVGCRLRTSSEGEDVAFADPSKRNEPNVHPPMRMRIGLGPASRAEPYID